MDVEGILATTSEWRQDTTRAEKVRGNFLVHASGYPEAADLLDMVKSCRPVYGVEGVGEVMDTEGSDHIIAAADRADDGLFWSTVWGGANCLTQALSKVRASRSAEELAAFTSRLRVYANPDQDVSGPWMRRDFPDLFYVGTPGDPRGSADYQFATRAGMSGDRFHGDCQGPDCTLVHNMWLSEHVHEGHGRWASGIPRRRI